jgi:tetratricopeptide (TPR) repeat protein
MTRRCSSPMHLILWTSFLTVCLSFHESPAATPERWIARAVSVQGTVESQRIDEPLWQPVKLQDTFRASETIRVLERSRADVSLLDQSVLRLNANATLTFKDVKEERTSVIDLLRGAAHFLSRGPRSLEVQTPFATAGIRGTEFFVRVEADQTFLSIFEGTVVVANEAGSLLLTSGQSAVVEAGKAPVLRIVVRPRDAVQWALYYPPVLYVRPEEFPPGPDWPGMVRRSIELYLRGDLQGAFDSIANVPPDIRDPRVFAYRAQLLLAVGRVDEAGADLERALRLAPNDPNVLALQTIIAIVQNEPDQALDIAQRAVQAAPNSATARIALSYDQQARFDLEGARASLDNAVQLEPQNALAWARLAELQASFGELKRALKAAQQAVNLEPNLARTQTVLGYVYLTQVKTTKAKEAFEKAIVLDQADPLPRLGLGLAKIRVSHLDEGGRDIEIAASLDPNNSIVRSYLGKTYYEEKRTGLDEREYAVAKELDPRDPTPWLYDAIAKQTTNRPVEALRDLQQSITLNDNRAVYRSRLLLDSDLAARSASLARIYSDLGFQPLALVEGWKSVNIDPSNFSAHRFLADTYAVLPRHEIARVSELLQSQLLQPINITPIQPILAESNLFLISAGGPGAVSFNEFNPLFNRNRVALQATGLIGENSTFGGEGVASGIYNKASFSLGYARFETDGFRLNSDQKIDIANAFLQGELSPQTSVQFEYRFRDLTSGDLRFTFFPEDVRPNLRQTAETETYRAGLRHAFSPSSMLLGSVMYQRRDTLARDKSDPQVSVEIKEPDLSGMSGELQHLFRSRYINVTSGVGYFNLDRQSITTLDFVNPLICRRITCITRRNLDAKHTNVYLYSYINFLKDVTFTLGASGDFFNTNNPIASVSTDQFNPKVGITWNILPSTTLRAAAFRAFKRTLITNQTLEPTQVAGFNQFYDDLESTESWRYGVAVDQKFSQTIFGGVEFSRRDLSTPIPFRNPFTRVAELLRGDWQEQLGRAYLFWTPHDWLALSTGYQYERFDRDLVEVLGLAFKEVTTQRVPLGLRLFHPSGLSLALLGTYFHQHGEFQRRGVCCESGASDFWVVDAAISYRLPKRYGFLTVGATNLLDQKFKFQETAFENATIQPDRMVFGRVTLAFP